MRRIVAVALSVAPLLAGCYTPKPPEPVSFDDSPADIRACRRLGSVSDPIPTGPGLEARLDAMRDATVALGGTDLLLAKRFRRDWSFIEGIAYRCPSARSETTVIRVRY